LRGSRTWLGLSIDEAIGEAAASQCIGDAPPDRQGRLWN
jgi:hypothetical protein